VANQSELTKLVIARAKELLDPKRPMTLRHLYYLLVSAGMLNNERGDYRKLARIISMARRRRLLDFDSLVDNIRISSKPSSWSGLADWGKEMALGYRKNLWSEQKDYIEFWIEKDAIASVVGDVTWEYDVRIRPLRGYSSLTFLRQASRELARIRKPIHIYYLGDHDPSGLDIERTALRGLRDMFEQFGAPSFSLSWHRLALLPEDFERFHIIPLPAKPRDARYKDFVRKHGTRAAELDALPPEELRKRVETVLLNHIDAKGWTKLKEIERLERTSVQEIMFRLGRDRSQGPETL
jgi:hypothetical protein